MQTSFTSQQLRDPDIAGADRILRSCVHCGFCNATCPTHVLLGDERDSPRGRIYLIKAMLEEDAPATADIVPHIDRCLSCLSCMTTCPSGVDYRRLIDQARIHVERTYKRPLGDRLRRHALSAVMTRPKLFRFTLAFARPFGVLAPFFRKLKAPHLAAGLQLAAQCEHPRSGSKTQPRVNASRGRVSLLSGCVEGAADPAALQAAQRLLTRLGFDTTLSTNICCGSLPHHLGLEQRALQLARAAIDHWEAEEPRYITTTSSGCGATMKDYAFLLRHDPLYAERARILAAKMRDITEVLAEALEDADLTPSAKALHLAYHAPCSLQHGQKLGHLPRQLLEQAGFRTSVPDEAHLCCGSAGTYNILQPELADRLKHRKVNAIAHLNTDAVATGNIGCSLQLRAGLQQPISHVVEFLDWAYGGDPPQALTQKI